MVMVNVKFKLLEDGTPTLKVNNEDYFNWDVFETEEMDYTFSISRQGKIHLIPASSISEVVETKREEWIEISYKEFERRVESEQFNLSLEKSAIGDEVREIYEVLQLETTNYTDSHLTVTDFKECC
jgi:hypothetical protein